MNSESRAWEYSQKSNYRLFTTGKKSSSAFVLTFCRRPGDRRSEMRRSAASHAPGSATFVSAPEWKAGWTPDQFPRLAPAGRHQAHGGGQGLGKIMQPVLFLSDPPCPLW